MSALEFEILGLPKLPNQNLYKHWAIKAKDAKRWKGLVVNAVRLQQKRGAFEFKQVGLCLTRFSTRKPDYDGLVSSFKHVVDGLIEAGVIIDDSDEFVKARTYSWVYASPKQGKIKVRVEERK